MEKKSGGRACSPCERLLNAIRTIAVPVFRAIGGRVPPGGRGGAPLSPPPPPQGTLGSIMSTSVENGKEKDVTIQNNIDDQVPIIKSEKIALAIEPVPTPNQVSGMEKTRPKGQLGIEVTGVAKRTEVELSEAASVNGGKKSNPQVQIREGTNYKGSSGHHIEKRFSDYIEQVRLKLRTVSNVGGSSQEAKSGKEKGESTRKTDEHFTNYITKARIKLRTASNIGGGKAVPSK